MDHFVALSLNLTTIFHLFPSIGLPTIWIIYNKEVGNYTKTMESKMELEELAIEKLTTYLSSNHVTNHVKSTLLPNNTLSPNKANPPNAKETKVALGALVTFFMKKKRCYDWKGQSKGYWSNSCNHGGWNST